MDLLVRWSWLQRQPGTEGGSGWKEADGGNGAPLCYACLLCGAGSGVVRPGHCEAPQA